MSFSSQFQLRRNSNFKIQDPKKKRHEKKSLREMSSKANLLLARDPRSRRCRLLQGTRDNRASEESSQNAGSRPQPRAFPLASRTRLCSLARQNTPSRNRDELVTRKKTLAVVASCRHSETFPHWRGCRACPVEVGTSEIWNLEHGVNTRSTLS